MGNLVHKVCPLCKKESEFQEVLLLENVFASGDVFEFNATSQIGAENYAKGDCTMDMRQCLECGFIYNFAFDMPKMLKAYSSEKYYQQLNFTQRTSKTIKDIRDLILRYADDNVFLEVAPGHCDLVVELSKSAKYIYTIDPSPTTQARMPSNIKHIKGFFDAEILRRNLEYKVNFIIFRHLLEHIETPREFLEDIVGLLDIGGKIYVEVPNAETIFKNQTFYDFYHEHVNYFTQNTLINIFGELGCECVDSISLYEGQHMGFVFVKTQNPMETRLKPIIFDKVNFTPKIQEFNSYLKDYQSISLWGGGDTF